jgi:hypothetical protein
MTVPVWLLDIDGVINAATRGKPPTHAWPATDWIDTRAKTWRILAARPVLDFIRTVHEKGMAEIRWHTTWQHDAQLLADALDLPTFSVQHAPEFDELRAGWWKLPAAHRALDEGRGLVWTDDDIAVEVSDVELASFAMAGAVVLTPPVRTGLCPRHLEQIDTYLAKAGQS